LVGLVVCTQPHLMISLVLRLSLVPDLFIRGPRKNLLLHQFVFLLIRSALDDLHWGGLANAEDNGSPTKRDENNDSHDGKQKACSNQCP
jgi:hypothetical protein